MNIGARTAAWAKSGGGGGKMVSCVYNLTSSDKRWFDLGITPIEIDILEICFLEGISKRYSFGSVSWDIPFDISFYLGDGTCGVNGMYGSFSGSISGVWMFDSVSKTIIKDSNSFKLSRIGDGNTLENQRIYLLRTFGDSTIASSGVKFSYLKTYKNSLLSHHIVAWVDENSIPCIKDLVNGKVIYSQGEGDLSFEDFV